MGLVLPFRPISGIAESGSTAIDCGFYFQRRQALLLPLLARRGATLLLLLLQGTVAYLHASKGIKASSSA